MTGPLILTGNSYLQLNNGDYIDELSDDVTLADASPNAVVSEEVISQLMSGINDQYVHVTGDTMTGDLIMSHLSGETLRSTYFDENGTIILGKDYSFSMTLTGNTNIDSFEKNIDYSCIWEYSIKNESSLRTGTISSVWYSTSDNLIYNHTSTNDIGDTRDFSFDILIISDQVKLNALTSGVWDIKIKRRSI